MPVLIFQYKEIKLLPLYPFFVREVVIPENEAGYTHKDAELVLGQDSRAALSSTGQLAMYAALPTSQTCLRLQGPDRWSWVHRGGGCSLFL